MATYRLTIPGVPIGQPRPRAMAFGGRARVYNPKHPVDAYKAAVAFAAQQAGVPVTDGPVVVHVTAYFPYPKSTPKKHLIDLRWHTKKPDADNIAKAVLDALSCWRDDSQVASLVVWKRFTTGEPLTEVVLSMGDADGTAADTQE